MFSDNNVCGSCCFFACAGAIKVDSFPLHLKNELQKLQDNEDQERQLQEIERNTCKVEIYVAYMNMHMNICQQLLHLRLLHSVLY